MARRGTAHNDLNRLKDRVAQLREEEHSLEREENAAKAEVAAASESLTRALVAGRGSKEAEKRLREAQAAAERAWGPMKEAARRKARLGQAEVERFARERSADLWREQRAKAEAAAKKVDDSLQAARDAIRDLNVVSGESSNLLTLQGEQPQGRIPQNGLEGIASDLKRQLSTPTPPPIPRAAPATVEAPPEAPGAWSNAA